MSVVAAGAYSSRWGRLIPIAFITYSLAYVDRANYSFGAAGGMAHDLNIDAAASSLLGALFFLGYFFFQVPSAYYAEKRSVKGLIFWSLILWGIFAAATGLLTDIRLLYVDRFLLGVMESVVLPGMLIFLGHWFTKAERSRTNTFLILGNPITVLWMSIVSGYLVQAFGWRGMFIIEGAPPIIWAFVWRAMVEDWPHQATWLDPNERVELERKLEAEQHQIQPVKDYGAAFRTRAKAIKASGLPRRGFHHLRHAHATQMLANGVHIKVASERLGHSTTGITMDLYQHVMPGMQEDAAAQIDAAYQKAITGPVRDQG